MIKTETLGSIGIPHVTINQEKNGFHSLYGTMCFIHYKKYLDETQIGEEILKAIVNDERYKRIDRSIIAHGSGGSSIDSTALGAWVLWRANCVGLETALENLDAFLDSDDIEVVSTLWVSGLRVTKSIQLDDGFSIVPAEEMPDSSDKEYFLTQPITFMETSVRPVCAITKISKIKKILELKQGAPTFSLDYQKDVEQLHYIAALINALPNTSCMPALSTTYSTAHTPLGSFGGTGGGIPHYDVSAFQIHDLSPDLAPRLNALIKSFSSLNENEKRRIERILTRFSQAKRRVQFEDKILDLGIVLEMLLLNDNERDQLSLSFRLRGSWLIGQSPDDRKLKYGLLKYLYDARSSVAHTGSLYSGNQSKFRIEVERFPSYMIVAESIIEKIILDGTPKWDALILDVPIADSL